MHVALLLTSHSSSGITSSGISSALPIVSGSQEVGTSLGGSFASTEIHSSYSFEKWMNFCSFKRQKLKLAVGPCCAVKMDNFLERICNSKIHLAQNRA